MRKLAIDADDLIQALTTNGGDFFLSLETGQVRMYFDGMLDGEEIEDLDEEIDMEDHVRIDTVRSSESFDVMEAFVETLPTGRGRDSLERALRGRKPFRSFKDALFDLGPVRDEWFRFEEKAQLKMAREWLRENGIEADLVGRLASS